MTKIMTRIGVTANIFFHYVCMPHILDTLVCQASRNRALLPYRVTLEYQYLSYSGNNQDQNMAYQYPPPPPSNHP
jgi:hypothetical protein